MKPEKTAEAVQETVITLKYRKAHHELEILENSNGDTYSFNPQKRSGEELADFLHGAAQFKSQWVPSKEELVKVLYEAAQKTVTGEGYTIIHEFERAAEAVIDLLGKTELPTNP